MAPRNGVTTRLSRDEWLARALDILATEGQAKLRVEAICAALGVTKGSFYWHFKDRDDFVRGLARYWSDQFTDPVMAQVTQSANNAGERLKALLYAVSDGGFARYDVSIRAWAAQDPDLVAALVRDVDERRLEFVGSIFAELGFEVDEIGMRARACIAYLSFESSFLVKSNDQDRRKMLDLFYDMIAYK
ncbi:Bacterial regulatory proteins, tetR family [uncultured Defluviicoccus sp.]|uniref:Bacterial regulatory proteins, tetR family n=1 Tax=metagenome TaxID=256318 RepID=A0A380TI84_9ZZZZ|nr:Bacterial regulatory proteins, tetR family [uncultured Defluviicoccus sp.]